MARANRSGAILEGLIQDTLNTYTGITIIKQFPLKDIFGTCKVDFKVNYKGWDFFIEAKNQSVPGSVDQKLPFYIENIRERKYPGHFVFVIKGEGIRNGAIAYLKQKQKELNFSIIDFTTLDSQLYNLLEYNLQQTINLKVKPIIKWAGGKRMIMDKIKNLFPEKIEGDYYEPFCGGFSVACELYNTGRFGENTVIHLNDNIVELVTLYDIVKRCPDLLIKELQDVKYIVNSTNFQVNKDRYNNCKNDMNAVEIAALFLFLNKSGFNGVYRENGTGMYNVPFCKKDNVNLYEADNIYAMHFFLQRCVITYGDYTTQLAGVKPGDFVYCDPPYHGTFNSYSKDKFGDENQMQLSNICYEMGSDGVSVVISNSDTDLIRELYHKGELHRIPVKRVVNSKSEMRGDTKYELFIQL